MELKCKRCGWSWDYHGERSYWVTCPNCRTSVKKMSTISLPNIFETRKNNK